MIKIFIKNSVIYRNPEGSTRKLNATGQRDSRKHGLMTRLGLSGSPAIGMVYRPG
jgi:hypothetical protein